MIFLKSLLFIVWNILVGASIVFLLRWCLFNVKARFLFGIHIPLTPGFLISKRDWVFDKVKSILHDYLEQADNLRHTRGYLVKWEKQIFESVWEKAQGIEGWKLMPKSWKEKLRTFIAQMARDLASKILRQMIPKLVEQLRIEHRIEEFDNRFSSEVIAGYYTRYVHKYLLYAFVGVNLLIGILNMILFWFIA
jgi:hypothetical protein